MRLHRSVLMSVFHPPPTIGGIEVPMKGFMKYLISESLIEPLVFRAWDAVCGQTFLQRAICQNAHDGAFCRTIIRRIVGEHSNCVDVGANRGEFLREMVECAPRGHHYAFEPLSDLADALQERYPGVRVWPAALGDQMGRAEFLYVVSNSPMSGFRRLSYYGRAEEIRKIAVAVYRLDDLLPPDFKVDLMKVDVEGAEYQVFQGGMRTLKTFKPGILFEFFRDWATTYGTTPEMIHRLLVGECGLQIWLPDEWLCGRPALTLPRLGRVWRNRVRQDFFSYR